MKKLNRLLIGSLAIPICALSLMPLVSCGGKPEVITPTINLDPRINNVECSQITKNNDFTVELVSTDAGWRKIDENLTTVLVDNKKVNFSLVNNTKIKVSGSVVTGSKVEINLVAGKSLNTIWAGLDTATSIEGRSFDVLHVGDTIKVTTDESSPQGLNVWLLYGSYSKIESENDWRDATIGSGNNQYKLYDGNSMAGGKDITETFKSSGYNFTEADLRSTSSGLKPKSKTYDVVYTLVDKYGAQKISNWSLNFIVANKLKKSECSIFSDKNTVEQGSDAWMDANVNAGALDWFTYTIESDPSNTGSTIENGHFTAGTAATGTVTIKGTSSDIQEDGTHVELTTTIEVVAPTVKQ